MFRPSSFALKLTTAAVLLAAAVLAFSSLRVTVKVAPVVRGRAVNAVSGSVTVQAEFQMDIKSEAGGRVLRSELEPGREVAAGAFLAQLDPGDLDLEIERIESDLAAARKRIAVGSALALQRETAQADLENSERLFHLGNLSEAELQKQRRAFRQIEQSLAIEPIDNRQLLDNYENTLKAKRRQRDKLTITAPFAGVVATVSAHPGDLLAGNAPLATLISTSRIVVASISEENFAGLRVGQPATVRLLGYGDRTFPARVARILPTADPATQRYLVYLDVEIAPALLVPGLTGEASIIVGERPDALLIPRRALFGGSVCVAAGGRVELRPVSTGSMNLGTVEVLAGLREGELVLVDQSDRDRVRSGDRVRTRLETP